MAQQHARYSPSKLEALESCPCFEYAPEKVTAGEESAKARGTRLHSAVEREDLELCLDEEERTQVGSCIEFKHSQMAAHPEALVLHEEYVEIPDLTYGTLDFGLLWSEESSKRGLLADWKFNRAATIPDARTNLQIACYGTGLLSKYPDLESVRAHIFAPGLRWAPDPMILTRADIPAVRARIEKILVSMADPFKRPTPWEGCARCGNAYRCPALGATALVVAEKIGLPMPSVFQPGAMVSGHDRGAAQLIADVLENWAEQVKAANRAAALEGAEVAFYKLVSRTGSYKVEDPVSTWESLRTLIPEEVLLNCAKFSLPELVKAYAESQKETQKAAREILLDLLKPCLKQAPTIQFLQRTKEAGMVEAIKPLGGALMT